MKYKLTKELATELAYRIGEVTSTRTEAGELINLMYDALLRGHGIELTVIEDKWFFGDKGKRYAPAD